MSGIEYQTEGRVKLMDGMNIKGNLVWTKGGKVACLSVGSDKVLLTAVMLDELVKLAPAIAKDLRMGHPTSAIPQGGIGGVP